MNSIKLICEVLYHQFLILHLGLQTKRIIIFVVEDPEFLSFKQFLKKDDLDLNSFCILREWFNHLSPFLLHELKVPLNCLDTFAVVQSCMPLWSQVL